MTYSRKITAEAEVTTVKFTLPMPPSANRYWRKFRNRIVMSDEARAYKQDAAYLVREQGLPEIVTGEIAMTVRVYRERKSGDLTNRLKVLEDALQGVLYLNDSQIVESHSYRYDDKHNPRVEVEITPA